MNKEITDLWTTTWPSFRLRVPGEMTREEIRTRLLEAMAEVGEVLDLDMGITITGCTVVQLGAIHDAGMWVGDDSDA